MRALQRFTRYKNLREKYLDTEKAVGVFVYSTVCAFRGLYLGYVSHNNQSSHYCNSARMFLVSRPKKSPRFKMATVKIPLSRASFVG